MSARTDTPAAAPRSLAQSWRFAGLLWGCLNLLALGVGLFPQLLFPTAQSQSTHMLQFLAVAQVEFLLVIYPAVLMWRQGQLSPNALSRMPYAGEQPLPLSVFAGVAEAILWILLAVPFWATAGYFADAAAQDVVRTGVLVGAFFVPAWGFALLARHGEGGRTMSMLLPAFFGLGGPLAIYLTHEFLPAVPGWVDSLIPAGLAWGVAQSRLGHWEPQPLWALALYLAMGIALMMLHAGLSKKR